METQRRKRPQIVKSDNCASCGENFSSWWSLTLPCRGCGHLFCAKCLTRKIRIPELGYTRAVFCCDNCVFEFDPLEKVKLYRTQISEQLASAADAIENSGDLAKAARLSPEELQKSIMKLRLADDLVTGILEKADSIPNKTNEVRDAKKQLVIDTERFLSRMDVGKQLLTNLQDEAKRKEMIRLEPLKPNPFSPKQRNHTISRLESPKSPAKAHAGLKFVIEDVRAPNTPAL